jgi:uncharacterized membrane protein
MAQTVLVYLVKKILKVDNKIEKAFGRVAVFAGVIFLITGVLVMVAGSYIIGTVIILVAVFVVFTDAGVELDTEMHRMRMYNNWFGFFRTGKWKSLHEYIGVTLVPFSRWESMSSWSNRTTSTKTTDYRIFLVNEARKPAVAIKKCKTRETAQNSLDEFSLWLKIPVYSVKA